LADARPAVAVVAGQVPGATPEASPEAEVTMPEPDPTVADRAVSTAGSAHPCAVDTLSAQ
jgi:hypothetical protein